jgi:pentatricopeptide repeat protein
MDNTKISRRSRQSSGSPTGWYNPPTENLRQSKTDRKGQQRSVQFFSNPTKGIEPDSVYSEEAELLQQSALSLLEENQFLEVYNILQNVMQQLNASDTLEDDRIRLAWSQSFDSIVQAFCGRAFTMPAEYDAVIKAVDALQLQLSSEFVLAAPYNTVPKRTLTRALNALTSVNEVHKGQLGKAPSSWATTTATTLSFRILQRLITGMGVRRPNNQKHFVNEREINQVLNVLSNLGRMDMAHRIVALQERTKHAPPLSPVAYSIMLKGYGRQADLLHVQEIVQNAKKNGIRPDVVLLNTLIDAYINCKDLRKARKIFDDMRNSTSGQIDSAAFPGQALPRPNRRTYNTMLKGLANAGAYHDAVKLSEEMERLRIWDPVTTNTLVHAAVVAEEWAAAELVLSKYTIDPSKVDPRKPSHPNVEAHTELLDAHAKAGNMVEALRIMTTMSDRGVRPNSVTYTCLVAGFGRSQQLDEARRLLDYMSKKRLGPSTVTYNALISGILAGARIQDSDQIRGPDEEVLAGAALDHAVDQCLSLLRDMRTSGVRPNAVTASVLVEAMGRCSPVRVEAATLVVEKMEKSNLIPQGDARVTTALIRTCGLGGDMKRAIESFRKLKTPDLVAVNAFIDACCRCSRHKLALDTFDHYFSKKAEEYNLAPDVITYSVLVTSSVKSDKTSGVSEAQALYADMKQKWAILPDTGMVDTILKAIIRVARSKSLSKKDILFVASLLRDAERLNWQEGQLERRKRAIRAILGDRLRETWLKDLGSMLSAEEDELFKRKGWNKVDSGFRLWGGGDSESTTNKAREKESSKDGVLDDFLESKGWNDVDSGFRVF